MSTLLRAVTRAANRRTHADQAYRAAITEARNLHSLSEIARAAGITPQGVSYLTRPDPRKGKTQ